MTTNTPINITEDGGITKQILKEGSGNCPKTGQEVEVLYVGKFEDGKVFDESTDSRAPFIFQVGKKNVIAGWDLGVASMKKGEKAILRIKSQYGYGEKGYPPTIPQNATLIFEIELLHFSGKPDVVPEKTETKEKTEKKEKTEEEKKNGRRRRKSKKW